MAAILKQIQPEIEIAVNNYFLIVFNNGCIWEFD